MTEFKYLARKEVEKLILELKEEQRVSLFEAMGSFRRQHRIEQFVSGWSKKYRELESADHEKIKEIFGFYLDYASKEMVWDILADMYIYN